MRGTIVMTAIDTFERVGLPACAANEHGRLVGWNEGASDFFGLSASDAIGCEWHGIITTVDTPGCCALCNARRALHSGGAAMPIDVTLSINGHHEHVTMLPVPIKLGAEEALGIVILRTGSADGDRRNVSAPIPIHSRVRRLGDDRIVDELTAREREVLACVVDGHDARGIAAQIGISHATARNYVQRILSKLGARNKAEAVNLALSYNLLAS
jgi:DNA-binding CsgD family transcriptional regulator